MIINIQEATTGLFGTDGQLLKGYCSSKYTAKLRINKLNENKAPGDDG